jgi:FkbM family methyltransferase
VNRGKQLVKQALERLVNRHRFNDSFIYHAYLRIFFPRHVEAVRKSTNLLRQLLPAGRTGLIFDIGANCGHKTVLFIDFADRVVSVEPSPVAAQVLRERFLHNSRISIVEKGCGATEGVAKFHLFDDTDCYNTFSSKWVAALGDAVADNRPAKTVRSAVDMPITTLDQLMLEYGVPSYIKIDVEGYEVAVLRGMTRSVPLLSFECNLPEFTSETLECIRILEKITPGARFNFCATEPPESFHSACWLTSDETATIVAAGSHPFMEIYCKQP